MDVSTDENRTYVLSRCSISRSVLVFIVGSLDGSVGSSWFGWALGSRIGFLSRLVLLGLVRSEMSIDKENCAMRSNEGSLQEFQVELFVGRVHVDRIIGRVIIAFVPRHFARLAVVVLQRAKSTMNRVTTFCSLRRTSCGFFFVGAAAVSSSSLSALSSAGEASFSGTSSSPTSGF
jgi:hypothetical protein